MFENHSRGIGGHTVHFALHPDCLLASGITLGFLHADPSAAHQPSEKSYCLHAVQLLVTPCGLAKHTPACPQKVLQRRQACPWAPSAAGGCALASPGLTSAHLLPGEPQVLSKDDN